jgi:signal transduction histidine kinase
VNRVQLAFQRERQFLSDAAHELKTAVAIQKSTLQLLEQDKMSEEEYRLGIERALEDTARTERLVADMLMLSSLEHAQRTVGRIDGTEPAASLNESLYRAIDRLAPLAKLKSVSIAFAPYGDLLVDARESELGLLWTNLIENAIQHSPPDSKVLIELSNCDDCVCTIRISDSGSGISLQDLPHVFERFYRSDNSRSRSTGGFGLGLSIAKAIVEKNQGTIRIQSTPQTGTRVEVEMRSVKSCHT